jgi:hypothetical protein
MAPAMARKTHTALKNVDRMRVTCHHDDNYSLDEANWAASKGIVMHKFRKQALWGIGVFFVILTTPGWEMNATASSKDLVSIKITEKALNRVIDRLLPLEITAGKNLTGIWIQSIKQLDLDKDVASFKVRIIGKNVEFASRIGQQIAKIKLGSVDWSFQCRTRISYDDEKGVLWIKPELEEVLPDGKKVDVEKSAAKFFTALSSKGYPVKLRRLDPLQFKLENRQLTIDLVIQDVHIARNRIYIDTRPMLSEGKSQ